MLPASSNMHSNCIGFWREGVFLTSTVTLAVYVVYLSGWGVECTL